MTNLEKQELRRFCKEGKTFKQIRVLVGCSDNTIRKYIEVFSPPKKGNKV